MKKVAVCAYADNKESKVHNDPETALSFYVAENGQYEDGFFEDPNDWESRKPRIDCLRDLGIDAIVTTGSKHNLGGKPVVFTGMRSNYCERLKENGIDVYWTDKPEETVTKAAKACFEGDLEELTDESDNETARKESDNETLRRIRARKRILGIRD